MSRSLVVIPLFALLLVACTSLTERADKLYSENSYEEAARLYELALKRDPEDREARTGLERSRNAWIAQKLLEVRKGRLEARNTEATGLLLAILEKEARWKISPSGAVGSTQAEEIDSARAYQTGRIQAALKAKKPLLASKLFKDGASLFENAPASSIKPLERSIQTAGKLSCEEMKSHLQANQLQWARFIASYCQYWGFAGPSAVMIAQAERNAGIGKIEAGVEVTELTPEFKKTLVKHLEMALKDSPWYEDKGDLKISMAIGGRYFSATDHKLESLIHNYSVNIPYTVTRREAKPAQEIKPAHNHGGVVLAAVTGTLSALSGASEGSNEVDNGDGTVTVTETQYRSESRSLTYSALAHTQDFKLDVKVSSVLGSAQGPDQKKNIEFDFTDSVHNKTYEHQTWIPDAQLYPAKPSFIDEQGWFEARAQKLAGTFKEKLKAEWRKAYCQPAAGLPEGLEAETIQRCLKVSGEAPPAHVDKWFLQRFGLGAADVETLLEFAI